MINPFVFYNSTVLKLEFNGADGSTIVDSAARHTPSLSPTGTRTIVSNRLQLSSSGYVRADASGVESNDFDFTSSDFSISLTLTASATGYIVCKYLDETGQVPALRLSSTTTLTFRSATNQDIISYVSPTSFIGTTQKIEVKRVGSTYTMLIDDVVVATQASRAEGSYPTGGTKTKAFRVGSYGGNGVTGFIDNFIVKKG
jgi:hypothetical protein